MIEHVMQFIHKFRFNREKFTHEKLKFRLSLLREEFNETMDAFEKGDAKGLVDGLIDIIVICIGTLILAGVNVYTAWNEVHRANMSKKRGIKPGREDSGGFDVIKPDDWKEPDHTGNTGVLDEIIKP